MRLPRRGDDSGQVATALVVCAALGALFLLVRVLLPLAGASDQRSRAQTAADAAALAHLEGLGERVEQRLQDPLAFRGRDLLPLVGCGAARADAADYAARNGARVTGYDERGCGRDRDRTRVVLEVQMVDALPTGQRSQARAGARMDFTTGRCRLDRDPDEVLGEFLRSSRDAQDAQDAQDAAREAAAEAAAALRDAVNATPEQRAALEAAARAAAEAADRAERAAERAFDAVDAGDVQVEADCGRARLGLTLELPAGRLVYREALDRPLEELLTPRLVSTRSPGNSVASR